MIKVIPLLTLICSFLNCHGQYKGIIDDKATHFQISLKGDSINFLVADTTLDKKKPIFLFCQGSQPIPLFIDLEENKLFLTSLSNFDIESIKESFHLVIISMPKTPLVIKEKDLNKNGFYAPNRSKPYEPSQEFIEADYLENYVNRANKVLKYLRKQTWVTREELIVAGHSQGSKVATKVAVSNKHVTKLGLFGANPFGRIDEKIRQLRLNVETNKISWKEADKDIESQYEFFKAVQTEANLKAQPELRAWKTFSEPMLDDWLKLEIPIYLAYGTEDKRTDLCDLVPLFFIQKDKSNLTLKRYIGL